MGSMQWIDNLGWAVKKEWQEILMPDKQVCGYFEELDGLTFMTIHGAGHMVPQFRPSQAYYAIFNWINQVAPFN